MNPLPADTGSAQGPGNKCSCSEMSLRLQGWPLHPSLHLAPLSAVSALCSFPPVRYRHCPPGQGLPFPSHTRGACSALPAFAVVLVHPSSCGPAWRLSSRLVSLQGQQRAQPVLGSGHPCCTGSCPGEPTCGYFPWFIASPLFIWTFKKVMRFHKHSGSSPGDKKRQ